MTPRSHLCVLLQAYMMQRPPQMIYDSWVGLPLRMAAANFGTLPAASSDAVTTNSAFRPLVHYSTSVNVCKRFDGRRWNSWNLDFVGTTQRSLQLLHSLSFKLKTFNGHNFKTVAAGTKFVHGMLFIWIKAWHFSPEIVVYHHDEILIKFIIKIE